MRRFLHILLVAVGLSGFLAGTAAAARMDLSQQDLADLTRAEDYLNAIKSIKARFLQVAPDGALSQGNLYINRPGRLRFDYDPPKPVLVVSDGGWVVFYDQEVNQTSRLPLQSTPLFELVRSEIKLRDSVGVKKVERGPGTLRVTLFDPDREEQGSITLVFEDQPFVLKQWLVRDAQGLETRVTMTDMQVNVRLDPDLFTLFSPNYDDFDQ